MSSYFITKVGVSQDGLFLAFFKAQTAKAMRFGYPDEEILGAIEEFQASMVIIPSAEDAPSEISKAASIIREETDRLKKPVLLIPDTGA